MVHFASSIDRSIFPSPSSRNCLPADTADTFPVSLLSRRYFLPIIYRVFATWISRIRNFLLSDATMAVAGARSLQPVRILHPRISNALTRESVASTALYVRRETARCARATTTWDYLVSAKSRGVERNVSLPFPSLLHALMAVCIHDVYSE